MFPTNLPPISHVTPRSIIETASLVKKAVSFISRPVSCFVRHAVTQLRSLAHKQKTQNSIDNTTKQNSIQEKIKKLSKKNLSPKEQRITAISLICDVFKEYPCLLKLEGAFRIPPASSTHKEKMIFLTKDLQNSLKNIDDNQEKDVLSQRLTFTMKKCLIGALTDDESNLTQEIINKETLTKEDLDQLPKAVLQTIESMKIANEYLSETKMDALNLGIMLSPNIYTKNEETLKQQGLSTVEICNEAAKMGKDQSDQCGSFLQKAFDILDAEKTVGELNNVNTD